MSKLLPVGAARSDAASSQPVGQTAFPSFEDRKQWYCLDRHKPRMRGVLHACVALTSPLWVPYQLSLCNASNLLASALALFAALFLFSASASFHLGRWSAAQERIAMKLDCAPV